MNITSLTPIKKSIVEKVINTLEKANDRQVSILFRGEQQDACSIGYPNVSFNLTTETVSINDTVCEKK